MIDAPPSATIFISFASEDSAWAHSLRSRLESQGFAVENPAFGSCLGMEWEAAWRAAVEKSDTFVLVFSEAGMRSGLLWAEAGAASASSKRIIPVIFSERVQEEMPLTFHDRQAILNDNPEEVARQIELLLPN